MRAEVRRDDTDPIPHLTVWVRLDLGAGPEWVAVGRIKGK